MIKTQFLREAARQRRHRSSLENRSEIVRHAYGNRTEGMRDSCGINMRIGQFTAKLDELSTSEIEMLKAQISKQLDRERRLHKARSYLYSVSRHIQLYTALKNLGCK